VNVELRPRAQSALDELIKEDGISVTEAVSQSVQAYGHLRAIEREGAEFLARYSDGTTERIKLI
jgi:hypothetical protein